MIGSVVEQEEDLCNVDEETPQLQKTQTALPQSFKVHHVSTLQKLTRNYGNNIFILCLLSDLSDTVYPTKRGTPPTSVSVRLLEKTFLNTPQFCMHPLLITC